ncbi:MAG: TonB-dependent receptor [Marinifilaceae bacterium]
MRQIYLFLQLAFLAVLFPCVLNAQKTTSNGVVRGQVMDTDGQPLPGVTVFMETYKSGVATDVDGNYILPIVPQGECKIKFSYIGYADELVTLNVKAGVTQVQNVRMHPISTSLSEVEVSESMQNYQRALNYQKNSKNLRNVVSADQVGRFPDANIGDAMKRISGINVQYDQGEARFGQIRGTAPEFSAVTVNGNRIPSAEGDVRAVQLDLVPADMVQTIVVNKVVTADMDGDAIGGSVDLVTKNSPTRTLFSSSFSSGWNVVSQRAVWNGALTFGTNIGNKFGFIVSGSYQNNPMGSDNAEYVWEQDKDGNAYVTDYQVRKYFVQRERQSYSLSAGYKFNNNHKLDVKGIYNRRNDWENRYRLRVKGINEEGVAKDAAYQTKGGSADNKNRRLERQETMDYTINAEHLFGTVLMDWNVNYAQASEKRPNERYVAYKKKKLTMDSDYSNPRKPIFTFQNEEDEDITGYSLDELNEKHQTIIEKDIKARLNFNIPFVVGVRPGNLKLGAKYIQKEKDRDITYFDYKPQDKKAFDAAAFGQLKTAVNDDFLAGNYKAGKFIDAKYLGGLNLTDADQFSQSENLEKLASKYNATERVGSGFLRYDQQVGNKFSFVAGLRAEATVVDYEGLILNMPEEGDVTLTPTPKENDRYLDLLPSLLLRYDLTDKVVLRGSYTRTLARPNYYDLVPYVNINGEDNEISMGNSALKAVHADNVDVSFEYYHDRFGQFSVGGYYKNISDFIVKQQWRNKEYQGVEYDLMKQPINGGTATLYGVEVSLQRDLGFIAPCLKYFGVYANYTYSRSRIKDFNVTREYEDETQQVQDEKLRLPGSPEHIANASVFFERRGLNMRVSYNFASNFIDEFGTNAFTDIYYDKVGYLDVNASYTFAKHYTLFAEATNLLNQPLRYYQGNVKNTTQAEYYGPRFNVGVKLSF